MGVKDILTERQRLKLHFTCGYLHPNDQCRIRFRLDSGREFEEVSVEVA